MNFYIPKNNDTKRKLHMVQGVIFVETCYHTQWNPTDNTA